MLIVTIETKKVFHKPHTINISLEETFMKLMSLGSVFYTFFTKKKGFFVKLRDEL